MTGPSTAARAKPKSAPLNDKRKAAQNPRQHPPQQNTNVKLKVVVRGLPPNLPETIFKETTQQWINDATVDWYYYVSGKLHERYI
jgi:hypothetical protein